MATDESADVAALERIQLRLAVTDDAAKLEAILGKLLPGLLGKLDPRRKRVQATVMKLLGHINKRLKKIVTLRARRSLPL